MGEAGNPFQKMAARIYRKQREGMGKSKNGRGLFAQGSWEISSKRYSPKREQSSRFGAIIFLCTVRCLWWCLRGICSVWRHGAALMEMQS